jgi:hypothetical protein
MKSYLSVDIKKTDGQVALVKQLGSKNKTESLAAAEAIAAVIAEPLLQVIQQAPVISNFFKVQTIGENEAPKIPLDLFFDVRQRNFLNIWTQVQGGGLATNHVVGMSDLFVQLYDLYGAASLKKSYARAARLDVVARTLERLAQEVLIKRNANAASVFMGSLAGARIDGSSSTATTNLQVFRSATQGVFQLDDFNSLMIKYRQIVSSWVGGTPVGARASLSDMVGSPNWMGQIRGIAYQPQNTRAGSLTTSGATAIAAPDSIRESVFSAAGNPELFGITLHEYNELGRVVAGTYQGIFNQTFADYLGAVEPAGYGAGSAAAFSPTTEEVVVGLNSSMFDLVALRQAGENSDWTIAADDQFPVRSDTVGWYGQLSEGFVSLDNRAKIGIIF